jgi:hypothetical protein
MSMASILWRVMQLIEANRHLAEQLETAASRADLGAAPTLSDVAAQRRRIAEEIYAQYRRDGVVDIREKPDPGQTMGRTIPMNACLALPESNTADDVRTKRLRRKAA